MTEFLAMNGHGVYVWSAYGVSVLVLMGVGIWPLVTMRRIVRDLRRRAPGRSGSRATGGASQGTTSP